MINKALWFMGFDKENRLPKDSAKVKRNPELYKDAFVSKWGIGFHQIKGYKFYMAGYEKDNNKPGI
jgi:hypothetical protein